MFNTLVVVIGAILIGFLIYLETLNRKNKKDIEDNGIYFSKNYLSPGETLTDEKSEDIKKSVDETLSAYGDDHVSVISKELDHVDITDVDGNSSGKVYFDRNDDLGAHTKLPSKPNGIDRDPYIGDADYYENLKFAIDMGEKTAKNNLRGMVKRQLEKSED